MSRLARLAIALIDRYRRAGGGAKLFWVECDFEPSCSLYAREAVCRHGFWRGARLSVGRLRRCRGRTGGPYRDPVPDEE